MAYWHYPGGLAPGANRRAKMGTKNRTTNETAIAAMLARASELASNIDDTISDANAAMQDPMDQNMAIGTIMGVERDLEALQSILGSLFVLHRTTR